MFYLWPAVNVITHVALLVLTCLSISAASSRVREHLTWLIPMALAWFLQVCGGLGNLVFLASIQSHGYSTSQLRWLVVPDQGLFLLGMLCLLVSAVALLLRMQALPRSQAPAQGDPNAWPPPPNAPQDR